MKNPKEQLIKMVGKENALKWIDMVKQANQPQEEVVEKKEAV